MSERVTQIVIIEKKEKGSTHIKYEITGKKLSDFAKETILNEIVFKEKRMKIIIN